MWSIQSASPQTLVISTARSMSRPFVFAWCLCGKIVEQFGHTKKVANFISTLELDSDISLNRKERNSLLYFGIEKTDKAFKIKNPKRFFNSMAASLDEVRAYENSHTYPTDLHLRETISKILETNIDVIKSYVSDRIDASTKLAELKKSLDRLVVVCEGMNIGIGCHKTGELASDVRFLHELISYDSVLSDLCIEESQPIREFALLTAKIIAIQYEVSKKARENIWWHQKGRLKSFMSLPSIVEKVRNTETYNYTEIILARLGGYVSLIESAWKKFSKDQKINMDPKFSISVVSLNFYLIDLNNCIREEAEKVRLI